MLINYNTETKDIGDGLRNVGLNELGLITCGQKITAGAPDTFANKYIVACIMQNEVDGVIYINQGSVAAPSWTAAPGGSSLSVSGTISSAEILDIVNTPVQVLPASGFGLAYLVTAFRLEFVPNTTPYTLPGPIFLRIRSGAGTAVFSNVTASGFLDSAVQEVIATSVGGVVGFHLADNANLIFSGVGGANPTLGDGTIAYRINYQVITL